jgi:hypothetical protein
MAFTKYIVPVKHQGRTFSPSIVIKDGKVLVNKLMAQYLQLDKHRSYDVYVDPERKLIGIDVGKGFTYTVRSKENAPTHSLVAVAQALKDAGCIMPKAAVIAFESGKSLPPPLLLQFSYDQFLPTSERRNPGRRDDDEDKEPAGANGRAPKIRGLT